MSTPDEAAAGRDVAGRENTGRPDEGADARAAASDLRSADDSEGTWKSKFVGVFLALIFGPLGLFYSTVSGALIMIVMAVPIYLITRGDWWFSIGGRLVCAVWAYAALYEEDGAPNPGRDSARLLNQAAALEKNDVPQAVSGYEEIIRLFPDTAASQEAARNIQSLTRRK